ncbi:MAG: hypothetical protein AAGJ82_06695, partial [Bacteroidota bacterium]
GGQLSGFAVVADSFNVQTTHGNLPAHLWQGTLKPSSSAECIAAADKVCYGLRQPYGRGAIIWIPSLLGLGARQFGERPLADWLCTALLGKSTTYSVQLQGYYPQLSIRYLQTSVGIITVLVNKHTESHALHWHNVDGYTPRVVNQSLQGKTVATTVIQPEQTLVIHWQSD